MARDSQTKTINGHEWEVTPWPAMLGIKIQINLARTVGPAILVASGSENIFDADIGQIVNALAEGVDEQKTVDLIDKMLQFCWVEGKEIANKKHFDEHFAANYAELFRGLGFILQVNFGNFSELVASIGSQAKSLGKPAKPAIKKKAKSARKSKKNGRRGGS